MASFVVSTSALIAVYVLVLLSVSRRKGMPLSRLLPCAREVIASLALIVGANWAVFTFTATKQVQIALEKTRQRYGMEMSLTARTPFRVDHGRAPVILTVTFQNTGNVPLLLNKTLRPSLVRVDGVDSLGLPTLSDQDYFWLTPAPLVGWTDTTWCTALSAYQLIEPDQAAQLSYLADVSGPGLFLFSLAVPIDEPLLSVAAMRLGMKPEDLAPAPIPVSWVSEEFRDRLSGQSPVPSIDFQEYISVPTLQ